MPTIFEIKKTRSNLTENEKNELFRLLEYYSSRKEGEWLKSINWKEDYEYYWCSAFRGGDILGAKPLIGNAIYIQDRLQPPIKNAELFWIQIMTSTVVHELRHAWQQSRYGKILWSLLYLPEHLPFLYGKGLIEGDAFKISDEAQILIEAKLNSEYLVEFSKRTKKESE